MSRNDLSGANDKLKLISSDDILGKDVIDVDGSNIGIVDVVHIDPDNLDFAAISVDEGFLRSGLTVGKRYIQRITPHALFLNIRPAFAMRGMLVFDSMGALVGKVKDIELVQRQNVIKELVVSHGLFGKQMVPGELIAKVGHNIFLNVTRLELATMLQKDVKK
jgi:sporulation protein YlmC with PRC-barrel domain